MTSDTGDSSDTGSDLPPMPDPAVEPPEPNPGGADARPADQDEVVPADLPIEHNPAVDQDAAPDDLSEGEDTSTAATRDEDPDSDDEAPV